MGTSKGYIPPTKPEWSNAKRAISSFLRNRDADSRVNAIQKFGEAMSSGAAVGTTSFANAAGNILGFAYDIRQQGLEQGLIDFGRSDLIGKSSNEILHELLYQFTNNSSSLEDSLAADSLSQALDKFANRFRRSIGKCGFGQFVKRNGYLICADQFRCEF